jgi:hypothetical protein
MQYQFEYRALVLRLIGRANPLYKFLMPAAGITAQQIIDLIAYSRSLGSRRAV